MEILGIPVGAFATGGVLSSFGAWAVWAILTGRLVTLREHSETRAENIALSARNELLARQVSEFTELARLTHTLLQAMQVAAQQSRGREQR